MITPMQAPSRLAITNIMPTKGLYAMVASDDTAPASPEQHGNNDGEPIEDFDEGGGYETFPLKQVVDAEHRFLPREPKRVRKRDTNAESARLEKSTDCTRLLRWSIEAAQAR